MNATQVIDAMIERLKGGHSVGAYARAADGSSVPLEDSDDSCKHCILGAMHYVIDKNYDECSVTKALVMSALWVTAKGSPPKFNDESSTEEILDALQAAKALVRFDYEDRGIATSLPPLVSLIQRNLAAVP